jgi:hypothetical protein
VSESVEAADRRQATVDGCWCQGSVLQRGAEQLDVRTRRPKHVNPDTCRPLEDRAEVAVALERAAAVAGEEGDGSQFLPLGQP